MVLCSWLEVQIDIDLHFLPEIREDSDWQCICEDSVAIELFCFCLRFKEYGLCVEENGGTKYDD